MKMALGEQRRNFFCARVKSGEQVFFFCSQSYQQRCVQVGKSPWLTVVYARFLGIGLTFCCAA
jgi:hypothetical protein